MSKRYGWILTVFVCAVSWAQQPPAAPAPPRDHYKFWKVSSVPIEAQVKLLGQFDGETWWDAMVDSLEFLGNPTKKMHRGGTIAISDSKLHLTAYALTPAVAQRVRTVTLSNQFTGRVIGGLPTEVWKVGDPELLLVPAGKKFGGKAEKPGSGDHYACYAVIDPASFPESVRLEDQFDARRRRVERINDLEPAYFCVPVQKRYGKAAEQPLLDAKTHLALYKIRPRELLWLSPLEPNTADQFGSRKLKVNASRMLAVPTTKLQWSLAPIFEQK